ncbi:MAG: NAD(P)-dependent oxidoreductase [Chitinophagales bacterium]|nr:NAD(P)-dependent oxidoreductase [Chitinophagales bacterium]
MKKLLITGSTGFLGYHLTRAACSEWQVFGVARTLTHDPHVTLVRSCDITNYIELGNFIEDLEPDAIIHAAAIADANFCEQNREQSYAVNVEASKNVAGICADYNIPMVFTSTDLVFDGKKGMYTEEDTKNPVSAYGQQKSIAEEEILKIYPSATVARLPMMFGYADASASNYLQKFIKQLQDNEAASLFHDEYRSVCGARSVALGLLKLMGEPGVIHIAGKERLSRYEFGVLAAKAFGLDESLLNKCSQKDVPMAAPRPADVSLDISKALGLGYAPLSVADELKLVAASKSW